MPVVWVDLSRSELDEAVVHLAAPVNGSYLLPQATHGPGQEPPLVTASFLEPHQDMLHHHQAMVT